MKVLLSIKPEYVEKIFTGKKNMNIDEIFLREMELIQLLYMLQNQLEKLLVNLLLIKY